jgi:hypothetical protein
MTVFVYVNTSKQVGDADHVKVFANVDAAEKWFEENDPEGVRPPHHHVHDADRGARGHLEFARSLGFAAAGVSR